MPFLDCPGHRIHYEDRGSGSPPLVFVHGFGCSVDDWATQLSHFAASHRVLACDQRSHGRSAGETDDCSIETRGADVAALLEQLALPPAILIGHSLGCRVVLEASRVAPERVAGLVLVDGSCIAEGDPAAAESANREAFRASGYGPMVQRLFQDMFLPGADAALKQSIVARALVLPESTGENLMVRMAGWDARHMDGALAGLAERGVPLMLIQSTWFNMQKQRAPLKPGDNTPWFDKVRRQAPGARIEVVGGAGHFTMLDAPEAVNGHIAAFIDRKIRPRRHSGTR